MTDPYRLDLPSASTAYRRRRCMGSENLIRALRKNDLLKILPPSDQAQSGTRIHAAWADKPDQVIEVLSPFEQETLNELQRLETMVLADWAGNDEHVLLGREERLWLRQGIEPLASGQYDVCYITSDWNRALLMDAKTLYGEIEPAESNDQLRELVALLHFNYPQIQHVTVALLVPNQTDRVSIANYDKFEIELALRLMTLTLFEAADPYAPRTPGSYCQYCPARIQCDEARALVSHSWDLKKRFDAGDYTLPLGEKGARILEEIKTVKTLLADLETAYKAELKNDKDCLPGWTLTEPRKLRSIPDVHAALNAWLACEYGLQPFLAGTEISFTRLQEQLGILTGKTGRALFAHFNEVFGPLIEVKLSEPSLARTKKALPPRTP